MSDHRFSLDATFTIYGKTFHWDTSLNWDPYGGCEGVDRRIITWFQNCYADARSGYDTYTEMVRAEENERWERQQLAQLKAKYEPEEHCNERGHYG